MRRQEPCDASTQIKLRRVGGEIKSLYSSTHTILWHLYKLKCMFTNLYVDIYIIAAIGSLVYEGKVDNGAGAISKGS